MSQLQAKQKNEAQGALNQALVAGLHEPLAAEAKRALADLHRIERPRSRKELGKLSAFLTFSVARYLSSCKCLLVYRVVEHVDGRLSSAASGAFTF